MNSARNRTLTSRSTQKFRTTRRIQQVAAISFCAIASISGALALNGIAHAARPEGANPGNQSASITIAATRPAVANSGVAGSVTFAVSANVRPKDEQYVWVRNTCALAEQVVSLEYQPVENGYSRPFSLIYAPAGSECTAGVFVWPNTASTLDGGTLVFRS